MVHDDSIKQAFQKIKHDIYSLYSEISSLKRDLAAMNQEMAKISQILSQLSDITENLSKNQEKQYQNQEKAERTAEKQVPTNQQINPTNLEYNQTVPTHLPAYFPYSAKEKQAFSTGNEGVPTNRQTDQQTDNTSLKSQFLSQIQQNQLKTTKIPLKNPIEDAARALDSLDSLKKEIRLKFKQLTDQEILIFSTLYQMEEENQSGIDYKTLALKLNLTESSIRDYIGRLLQKGIPVEKQRINNKKILLSVSQSLKRVASLQTILQLRDL